MDQNDSKFFGWCVVLFPIWLLLLMTADSWIAVLFGGS